MVVPPLEEAEGGGEGDGEGGVPDSGEVPLPFGVESAILRLQCRVRMLYWTGTFSHPVKGSLSNR